MSFHWLLIRKPIELCLGALCFLTGCKDNQSKTIWDPDKLIILDAEELAELGMASAYHKIKSRLRSLGIEPLEISEEIDPDKPSYAIQIAGERHVISDETTGSEESWANATVIFFSMINEQLADSPYKFYAIEGGHDLHGIFLTEEESIAFRAESSRKQDWPYFPVLDPPWYGQHH